MYKHCPIVVAISGFAVLVVGVICTWYAFPALVENAISEAMTLKDGNLVFESWKKQPFPTKYKIYFFNVSNTDAVQNGANPIVREVGPYIYDMFVERVNVEVNEGEDTIKYMLKKTFYFNPKESGCRSDEDVVTIINSILVGTALQVQSMLPSALPLISNAMPYLYPGLKDVFLRVRVKDFLFDGVRLHCQDPAVDFVCGAMRGALPKTVKIAENGQDFLFSTFNYYFLDIECDFSRRRNSKFQRKSGKPTEVSKLNGTSVGPYVMGRGMKNTTRGELVEFADEKELSVWGNEGGCNMINGSDSGMFFPMKKPVERLYSFTPDICRSAYVSFEKETTLNGLKVYVYSNKEESLGINKDNNCFCMEIEEGQYLCPPSGLLDLMPCMRASVLMSYPHFYLADKKLLDYVSGISPEKELHQSYLVIEPRTATPFEGKKRMQINIELKKMEDFELLLNVSEGVFPIVWIEESADLPQQYLAQLQHNFMMLDMLDIFKWTLITSGIIIMLSSFVLVMYQERLMCFSNSGKVTINVTRSSAPNLNNFDATTDVNFNGSVLHHPGLYPQMENRNVSQGLNRRSNNVAPAWTFKM